MLQWDVDETIDKEGLAAVYKVAREKVGDGRIKKLVRAQSESSPLNAAMLTK